MLKPVMENGLIACNCLWPVSRQSRCQA